MKPYLFGFICGLYSPAFVLGLVRGQFGFCVFVAALVSAFAAFLFWPERKRDRTWPITEEDYKRQPWEKK